MASERPLMPAEPTHRPAASVFQPADQGLGDVGLDRRKPDVLEVALIWNETVLEVQHVAVGDGPLLLEAEPTALSSGPLAWMRRRLGPKPVAHLMPTVAGLAGEEPLAQLTRTGFSATVRPGWSARLEDGQGARMIAVGPIGATVDAGPGSTLHIDTGAVVVLLRLVPAGLRFAGRSGQVDLPLVASGSILAAVGMLLAVIVSTAPPPAASSVVDIPDRFASVLLAQVEPVPAPVALEKAATNREAGRKAKREEGTAGEKAAKMKVARGDRTRMERQQLDREIAENAGILGVDMDSGALAGVFAGAMSADLTGGVGGLIGAKGVQMGSGGLGSRGSSLGGGGDAEGIGGLSTNGRNTGDGTYGRTGGRIGDKEERGLSLPGEPLLIGGLDRGLVDAVVKRHLSSIRYCYQRQLTRDPDLSGKMTVAFVIAADGSVSRASVKSSSLNEPSVEACVTNKFMTMQFPQPKGGGVVMVSYPFMFSPG